MKMVYLVLALLVLFACYLFTEPYLLKTKRVELDMKEENLKIVHLTDLHSKKFGWTERRVLERLREVDPDYIFVTGDFVDDSTYNLEECQQFWEALVDQHSGKVYGVLGNHEYRHPKTKEVIGRLKESGIKLLNNESVELNGLILGGVKSPHLKHDEMNKALKRDVDILLAHSPEIFRKVKDKKVDLMLSGHTHGGQINIPILRGLVLPLRYGKKYREGVFKEQDTYLHVSRGIGTSILPIRFNAPPEISIIEF
ncbi:MAG: metallophosphoesterase [Candidatus Paceibacterota bacterium]